MENRRSVIFITFLMLLSVFVWIKIGLLESPSVRKEIKTKETRKTKEDKTEGKKQNYIPVAILKNIDVKKKVKPKVKRRFKAQRRSVKNAKGKGSGKHNGNELLDIFATYDMNVREYLAFMRSKGSKVIVYDIRKGAAVCEVLSTGELVNPNLQGLSRLSRRITDDYPDRTITLKKVESKYGTGSYEILLLMPEHLTDFINNSIKKILKTHGVSVKDTETVFLIYRGTRSHLKVYVDRVAGKYGTMKINKYFEL